MAGKAGTERWRQRDAGQWQALIVRLLGGGLEQALPRESTSGFVDLGLLRPAGEVDETAVPTGRLELTLDLGGGVVLHLVRG